MLPGSMADTLTTAQRSALMARIKGVDTGPEMFVRRALHARGYRYRIHGSGLPGRPDLVFKRRRAAVFVHGCFWHRHGCKRTTTPKSRQDYWQEKFAKNVARDQRNLAQLADDGWRIHVVWECEIDRDETVIDQIVAFLGPPRANDATTADSTVAAMAASETESAQ